MAFHPLFQGITLPLGWLSHFSSNVLYIVLYLNPFFINGLRILEGFNGFFLPFFSKKKKKKGGGHHQFVLSSAVCDIRPFCFSIKITF